MIDLTHDAIQILLDHPRGEGMIVSCYADTAVTEGFVSLWSQHLKNEASAILFFAARHNITAHTVERSPALSRHGGVAAALSRSEPWEPAAAEVAAKGRA